MCGVAVVLVALAAVVNGSCLVAGHESFEWYLHFGKRDDVSDGHFSFVSWLLRNSCVHVVTSLNKLTDIRTTHTFRIDVNGFFTLIFIDRIDHEWHVVSCVCVQLFVAFLQQTQQQRAIQQNKWPKVFFGNCYSTGAIFGSTTKETNFQNLPYRKVEPKPKHGIWEHVKKRRRKWKWKKKYSKAN